MPVFLLLLFGLAVSIGIGVIVVVVRRAGRRLKPTPRPPPCSIAATAPFERSCFFRPSCWLAIKSRSLVAVQAALGLHNPKPCSWVDGLAGEAKLFIAPPVKGWILVMGSDLPDPFEDVDACYKFLIQLSRKLGQVQLFGASRILHHHAWVKAESGRVVRAYAWAGKTLWHQGHRTAAETELALQCFDYTELPERPSFGQPDPMAINADKVPMLAARWSLDPGRIDDRFLQTECGIAGERSWRL